MNASEETPEARVFQYHERTKHHYDRYARSPGYMDWANQPDPFRVYQNVPTLELPFLEKDPTAAHANLYETAGSRPRPFDLQSIAGLLELSVGLSAWKAAGRSRWSLRINPSSGNLHPTETHLVLPPVQEHTAGVYHYSPVRHELEKRATLPDSLWQKIEKHFGTTGCLIGLTSIFWRESWKYGERALRYCNHDVGHAVAAVRLAANLFGWKLAWLNAVSDTCIEKVLGLDRAAYQYMEEEHPDLLCWVCATDTGTGPVGLTSELVEAFAGLKFAGLPNQLSRNRVNWEIITQTAVDLRKEETPELVTSSSPSRTQSANSVAVGAAELIRRRRSATAFASSGSLSKESFQAILERTMPFSSRAPFDLGPLPQCANLILFVHRVRQLHPGLYAFIRCRQDLEPLREKCRVDFQWTQVTPDFPLYLLEKGNFRQTATMLSCHQSIAGEGIFSLAMLSRFRQSIESAPYRYRYLFWEAGMIGQVLYLEAEAHGLRGTGIGCYFDDAVHALLGLSGDFYQSLYHFTVGLPLEDERLTTLPPYYHLERHGA